MMWSRWWNNLPLSQRLLLSVGSALLIGGIAAMSLMVRSEVSEAQIELQQELDLELSLMPSALTEIIVAGDYASVKQYLDRLVVKPYIVKVAYVDGGGAAVQAFDKPILSTAPAWFGNALGFTSLSGRAPIVVGGTSYGELQLHVTAQGVINRTWQRLRQQFLLLAANILAVLFIVWQIQKRALLPLVLLKDAVGRLASGEAHSEMVAGGSQEVRALIHSFNQMTASLDAAHEEMRFFQVLSEETVDPGYAIDYSEGSRFAWVNQAAASHFNLPVSEVLKTSVMDWDPEFTHDKLEQLRQALRQQDLPPFITCHHLRDGRQIPIEVSSKLVMFKGHEYGVGYFRDITERRRNEIQLIEARDAAEAGNRAKSEFLANMSHEIRTPMNGVLGMAQLLLTTPLNAQQQEYLAVIRTSTDALLTVINDILDLSRIEAGHFTLSEEVFRPRNVVLEVVNLLATAAADKGVVLGMQVDADVPEYLKGDSQRLRQVLVNLLGNSVKFTAAGSVQMRMEMVVNDADKSSRRIRCSVTDTGIGMSAQTIVNLFKPFSQADGSITRRFGGTGLGLSISKHIVHLMAGKMGVTSEEGNGSCFWFELPCIEAEAQSHPIPVDADAGDLPPGLRVLLVEDNLVNQKVAQAMLKRLACEVATAENGEVALSMLAVSDAVYDVVLMDCQMPVMDGFEATRRIRLNAVSAAMQDLPIIAMTANAMTGDRELCLDAGMSDYISKPVRSDVLKAVLVKYARTDSSA